jgi:hypothetical protein
MELKKQVCSLELAKKLKELGVKQDSHFYWWFFKRKDKNMTKFELITNKDNVWKKDDEYYSAYTVAELGALLPKIVVQKSLDNTQEPYEFDTYCLGDEWICSYGFDLNIPGNTEANSRSKMLIYLLENKLI